jgi:hypothetical protein
MLSNIFLSTLTKRQNKLEFLALATPFQPGLKFLGIVSSIGESLRGAPLGQAPALSKNIRLGWKSNTSSYTSTY